jgi:hypothetical protein
MAAENGATAHQLMAIFGWETLRQAEVYTRSANRTLLAEQAMHLLVRREKNKSGPELSHFSIPANECDKNGS